MPLQIDGVQYLTLPEMLAETKVTRQTLWRWRQEGRIPAGRRTRTRQVVFSAADVEAIRGYANRVEPIEGPGPTESQLNLFREPSSGTRRR